MVNPPIGKTKTKTHQRSLGRTSRLDLRTSTVRKGTLALFKLVEDKISLPLRVGRPSAVQGREVTY